VAVLYFENQSSDSADSYLATGLTEAIITKLGDIPRLTVKSRYVVRRYQGAPAQTDPAQIGRALGVAYIVTGSVQRAGTRLRVTAEMARAATGDRAWGQQYERGDGDVFAIQEDIARGVATGVAGRLLPAERASLQARPTRNNEAYDDVLRGDVLLSQRTPASVLRAIAEYEAAARLDPSMASAWARIALADALRLDWQWGDGAPPPDSVLANGLAAADRALTLDSLSSDGWLARGYLMMFRNPRDFSGAEEGMRRAIALNPRNAEAWSQLGDFLGLKASGNPARDSVHRAEQEAYRRALEIEPSRPTTLRNLAGSLDDAHAQLALMESAMAIDPVNYFNHLARAQLLLLLHDTAQARISANDGERLAPEGARLEARGMRANLAISLGDSADARIRVDALLRDLPATGPISARPGSEVVQVLVRLGDLERAFAIFARIPRGAFTWGIMNLGDVPPQAITDPRIKRVFDENRPPWAR
jgi:TolB-like protein